VLREGLEATPGDLAESQVDLLKAKMEALLKDLDKSSENKA